jgi:LuxR family transcriptional regulator, maltose regulon positive regulatory protein
MLPTLTARSGTTPATSAHLTLTERDRELLGRLSGGWSTAQIAEAMSLTDNTVRTRIRRLERKMAVTGRDRAVRRAHDLGIA